MIFYYGVSICSALYILLLLDDGNYSDMVTRFSVVFLRFWLFFEVKEPIFLRMFFGDNYYNFKYLYFALIFYGLSLYIQIPFTFIIFLIINFKIYRVQIKI